MVGSDDVSAPPMLRPAANTQFDATVERVLTHLHAQLGLSLWTVTQRDGDDWRVIAAVGDGWSVSSADLHSWAGAWCSRTVEEQGSTVVLDGSGPIGSFLGAPIVSADGSLFGTICGIDPDPQPQARADDLGTVTLFADLLASILVHDERAQQASARAEDLEAKAVRDGLTGLLNRAGWNQVVEREADRIRRYGHGAVVTVVDMDELKAHNDEHGHARGDELLQALAAAMAAVSRSTDAVARLGGDEFALLAVETADGAATEIAERIRAELATRGVEASIGAVDCVPCGDLLAAWRAADMAMYDDKRARRDP